MVNLDDEFGRPGNAAPRVPQAGGHLHAPHRTINHIGEASVGDVRNFDGKSGVEHQHRTGTNRQLRGLRHQLVPELGLCRHRDAAGGNGKRNGRTESQWFQSGHLFVQHVPLTNRPTGSGGAKIYGNVF